jgi:hypothetical protein
VAGNIVAMTITIITNPTAEATEKHFGRFMSASIFDD